MNRPYRPSRVTARQSVQVAVANPDAATAERLFRAIVKLIVGPAMIGTVIACLCDIEAAMVAKPSRQEPGLLPVDLDQKTICGGIASLAGVAGGYPGDTRQHREGKDLHARYLSKSCSASKSTIAVCGRDRNRQAPVHGRLLRSAQNRYRLS